MQNADSKEFRIIIVNKNKEAGCVIGIDLTDYADGWVALTGSCCPAAPPPPPPPPPGGWPGGGWGGGVQEWGKPR